MEVKRLILRAGRRRRVVVVEAGPLVPEVGSQVLMDDGLDYTVSRIESDTIAAVIPTGGKS